MTNATVRAKARTLPEATEPESAADEYLRLGPPRSSLMHFSR
jgi:hypothetical protein